MYKTRRVSNTSNGGRSKRIGPLLPKGGYKSLTTKKTARKVGKCFGSYFCF